MKVGKLLSITKYEAYFSKHILYQVKTLIQAFYLSIFFTNFITQRASTSKGQ